MDRADAKPGIESGGAADPPNTAVLPLLVVSATATVHLAEAVRLAISFFRNF